MLLGFTTAYTYDQLNLRMKNLRENACLLRRLVNAVIKEQEIWKPINYAVENDELRCLCYLCAQSAVIGRAQRNRTVQWLVTLNKRFGFHSETLFHAINILDEFLTLVKANSKYLRCISIACLYLAAKTYEEDEIIPTTRLLIRGSECGCSVAEVLRMEQCILDKLGWNIRSITSLDFLQIFHSVLFSECPDLLSGYQRASPSGLLNWMETKLYHCLGCHDLLQFSPSTQAMAVVCVELDACRPELTPVFVDLLGSFIQVEVRSLLMCKELVLLHISRNTRSSRSLCGDGYAHAKESPSSVATYIRPAMTNRRGSKRSAEDEGDAIYDGIKRLYETDSALLTTADRNLISSLTILAGANVAVL